METGPENEVLTVGEMDSLLGENGSSLANAVTALEAAERTYAHETSRSRYLSDAAHELSFSEHLPALEAAERHATAMAATAEANARTVRRQLNDLAGPTLTETELATASARMAVVQLEVDRAPLSTVLAGVRRAIATQDRPGQFLYHRLLVNGPPPPPAAPAAEGATGVPLPPDERAEAERGELRRLMARIADQLRSTEFDGLRKQADAALERAVLAGIAARKRRQTAAIEAEYTSRGFVHIPPEAA
jgi:hypothetical protein